MKTMRQENTNSEAKTYRSVWWLVLVLAFAVTGCGNGSSKTPPKQKVQDMVRASLPSFLTLDAIDVESIPTGPEEVKVNFKSTVTPKEDLYQIDREVQGTPKVTLLKVVQTAGSTFSLYGFVAARRTMDQWTIDRPQIEMGLRQFGAPKAAFDAQSYITGSSAANDALRQQADNAAKLAREKEEFRKAQERELKARLERQAMEDQARREREAIEEKARQEREEKARVELETKRHEEMVRQKAEEAQRQKEEQILRQKLQLATVPGKRYVGTATRYPGKENQEVSRCRLVFKEQKDLLVTAELSNPDIAQAKRTFTGELRVKHKMDKTDDDSWNIVMSPIGPDAKEGGGMYNFWCKALNLRLTDKGIEGVARHGMFGEDRTLRLQRE